jgi:membrane-bound inhibitor of C-type lysozyme
MTKTTTAPLLLLVLALAGCAGQKYGHAPVTPQRMSCSGNVPADVTLYSPAEAKLHFEEKSYTLNRIETASGVQYGNSDITFWNKGIDAMIIRKDGSMTTCTYMPKSGL